MSSNNRSEEAKKWRQLYKRALWKKLRIDHISEEPMCRYCLERDGSLVAADIVDHITPHKGDEKKFFNPNNLQSLCESCHNGEKAMEENGKKFMRYDENGIPIGFR